MKKGYRKQFCSKGHNMLIVGRTPDGHHCLDCYNEKRVGPKPKNPLCINGHNKDIVGRCIDGHCKECKKMQDQKYNKKNKEKIDENKRQYVIKHPEVGRKAKKKYDDKHPELKIKCKTNRALRVVSWTDWNNINKIYLNRPKGKVVDHIIPLCGRKVAGLDVSWNLQYLTSKQNSSKGNRIDLLWASEWYGKILEIAGLK